LYEAPVACYFPSARLCHALSYSGQLPRYVPGYVGNVLASVAFGIFRNAE